MKPDNDLRLNHIYSEYLEEYNNLVKEMEDYFHKNKDKTWFSKNFIDRFSSRVIDFFKRTIDSSILSKVYHIVTKQEEFETFRLNILKLSADLNSKAFQLAKGEL